MLLAKPFFGSLNRKLLISVLYRYQMAPVTRQSKTSASAIVANRTNSSDNVAKKVVSPKKQQSANVNKTTAKSQHTGKDGLPIIAFPSKNELEDWFSINHTVTTVTGLWVKIAKKSSGIPTITSEELLDVLLCYGWIDGQRCGLDETWFLQRITPRRSKSNWSQINREKVNRLIRIGKMQPAGQRLIDEAKADGRWDNAYKPTSGCVVPDELTAAIELSSTAMESFRALSKPDKLILINRIETTTSSRSDCIKSIVESLERKESGTESV